MIETLRKGQTIPANTNEDIVSREELQKLHAQVEKLLTFHQPALKEEGVLDDVEKVLKWVDSCGNGSQVAERKLYQQGIHLLENVSTRLQLALQQAQQMSEESPAAANQDLGRDAERYAKASGRTNAALKTLSELAENSSNKS